MTGGDMEYKYIEMTEVASNGKTKKWDIINKNSQLVIGYIGWYPYCRQYCFTPNDNTIYSVGCLNDIVDFISKHKDERKF